MHAICFSFLNFRGMIGQKCKYQVFATVGLFNFFKMIFYCKCIYDLSFLQVLKYGLQEKKIYKEKLFLVPSEVHSFWNATWDVCYNYTGEKKTSWLLIVPWSAALLPNLFSISVINTVMYHSPWKVLQRNIGDLKIIKLANNLRKSWPYSLDLFCILFQLLPNRFLEIPKYWSHFEAKNDSDL